jgi:ribose transport system permease protein
MTGQATAPPPAPAEAAQSEDEPTGRLARLGRLQALQIIIVLAVIVAIFAILKPGSFLTVFNIRGIVINTAILAVLAVGMTFVIITGGIDLSIGSVLVFSGVVADKAMAAIGGGQGWGSALIGAAVAIACGLAWGLVNGFLIARAKVPPLIVTLGTLGMALGLAEVITGGVDLRNVPTVMVNDVGFGNIFWQVPTLAVIAAVIIVLGAVGLHRTRFGLHTYAIGSNPEAGRRSGVNVPRHLIMVYALSGLLAGFAGWLNLAFFQSTTIGGQTSTNLSVIAGVVIGGTSLFGGYGSILGSVIGVFIPATLQNGFVIIGVQPFWQQVVVGAVLIAAVYVDQQRRAAALRGGSPRMGLLAHLVSSRQPAAARELPRTSADQAPRALGPSRRTSHDQAAHPPKEHHESRCLRRPGQFYDQGDPHTRSETGGGAGTSPANRDLRHRPAYPQRQVLRRVPPHPRT